MKIAVIGAGSLTFCRKLVADILTVKEFAGIELSLMDISEENLEQVGALVSRDIEANGLTGVKLELTTDRLRALKDATYIINSVRIGGLEAFGTDIELPLEYGIDQCVGDTLCAGGIMYAQRTIPFILELCADIRRVCVPDALLLNYSNPNAMVTWAANTYGKVKTIGLCHGVQHGHAQLAEVLKVPKEELDYSCVGINHVTWYVELQHERHRYTADELLAAFEAHELYSSQEKVRIDMLKRFGYYCTESNGHLSEYLPWYRKRADQIEQWISTDVWINGQTGGYLKVCREGRDSFAASYEQEMSREPYHYSPERRSNEHASFILEALETGRVYRGHFNLPNAGIVTNLPEDCIVEVPCFVDRLGIHTPVYGDLPDGPAAVCLSNINVQRLAVKAAVSGDILLLKQAMLLDPLSGAVCDPEEIWQLADRMLLSMSQWLPQYEQQLPAVRERLASQKDLRRFPGYRGAVRL